MIKEESILEKVKLNRRKNLWKLDSLTGKEEELVEELEKMDADVVGLTETKRN